jgi:hypothetical protein
MRDRAIEGQRDRAGEQRPSKLKLQLEAVQIREGAERVSKRGLCPKRPSGAWPACPGWRSPPAVRVTAVSGTHHRVREVLLLVRPIPAVQAVRPVGAKPLVPASATPHAHLVSPWVVARNSFDMAGQGSEEAALQAHGPGGGGDGGGVRKGERERGIAPGAQARSCQGAVLFAVTGCNSQAGGTALTRLPPNGLGAGEVGFSVVASVE